MRNVRIIDTRLTYSTRTRSSHPDTHLLVAHSRPLARNSSLASSVDPHLHIKIVLLHPPEVSHRSFDSDKDENIRLYVRTSRKSARGIMAIASRFFLAGARALSLKNQFLISAQHCIRSNSCLLISPASANKKERKRRAIADKVRNGSRI